MKTKMKKWIWREMVSLVFLFSITYPAHAISPATNIKGSGNNVSSQSGVNELVPLETHPLERKSQRGR